MQADEINSIVSRISSIWMDLLKQKNLTNSFLREIKANSDRANDYEKRELLDQALEIIPIHLLYEKAQETCTCLEDLEDQVIKQLLIWFKNDFFQWINELPCDNCMAKDTISVGYTQATQQDLDYGASVIELYRCNICQAYSRFPRYNDPAKLLQTRKGRCGEWANCFTLCCRAIGVEARLVLDKTDHVWTEFYSTFQNRWIHCDPCEEAFDRPMMYTAGWNKELTYCIAFSADEVVDVTRRYVRDWKKVQSRRQLVDELDLANYIKQLCMDKQALMDAERRNTIKQRQEMEQKELDEASRRPPVVKDSELLGRQSGSITWRTLRGEQGQSGLSSSLSCSIAGKTPHDSVFGKQGLEKRMIFENATINNIQLLGSARSIMGSTKNIWRLTAAQSSQCGGLFTRQLIDISRGLETEFAFCMTNAQGGAAYGGADGMAFVIQANDQAQLGEGGCELGYGGIKNSLAIEFDTYDSSDRCADPSSNHISIQGRLHNNNSAHHDHSLKHTSAIPAMNSGEWIYCRIRYLTSARTMEVALKEPSSSNYITVLTLDDLDLRKYMNERQTCWIGFTASTGGLFQNHDLQWLSLCSYM
ncbi:uncharacterized protein BX664DRAFT_333873 [Halteromyces radiatus]|uniref:uncharacterized protein n=1 Tax=Halteromyces radiatus TaxID=101107 RepID=UPI00221E3D7C|nr:uncharacterized protein BX664DRAFT_333873 [Halteromyces radiatus]KAI8089784.1 hypothetical protein BX664DRAFT_333873 [Halteromyces radiatus]